MIEQLIKYPTVLSIVTTYRCTSSCKNCCFQCNPTRMESLDSDEIKKYIKAAVETYNTLKVVVFTGGECTLNKQLSSWIEYASNFGLQTRIVTNGYWAKTYKAAYNKISNWVSAGLTEINLSTGDDHLEYVPLTAIKNAIIASIDNGLKPIINVESAQGRMFNSKKLLQDEELKEYVKSGHLQILNGIWIPMKNESVKGTAKSDVPEQATMKNDFNFVGQRCSNLFNTISIAPNHRMLACCGLTSKCIKYLDLGNLKKNTIKSLYEKQFEDFLKIWLATEGPHKIMEFISQYLSVCNFDYERMHSCQVCAMIFNNKEYLAILQTNYKKVYTNVILKYLINK